MQALVVSAETVAGGEAINEGEGQVGQKTGGWDGMHSAAPVEACVSLCMCLGVFDPS